MNPEHKLQYGKTVKGLIGVAIGVALRLAAGQFEILHPFYETIVAASNWILAAAVPLTGVGFADKLDKARELLPVIDQALAEIQAGAEKPKPPA